MHMCKCGGLASQKRALDPLKLELQVFVSSMRMVENGS